MEIVLILLYIGLIIPAIIFFTKLAVYYDKKNNDNMCKSAKPMIVFTGVLWLWTIPVILIFIIGHYMYNNVLVKLVDHFSK